MNLKQLSEKLGLSQTTVSRALNGYPEVNEETRLRVQRAAETHNYRPNMRAKGLATGRSLAIGHVIPVSTKHEIVNPIFGDFIAGAGETYARSGYDMHLTVVDDVNEADVYRNLKSRGSVDGVVVHGPKDKDARIALLKELGLPFVVHGRSSGISSSYSWVDVNNRRAFERAADFLLDLGHRRIGFVNGLETMDFALRRRAGYLNALANRNVEPDPDLMWSDEMTEVSGYRSTLAMLDGPAPPSAFLVSSVIPALGVRRAIEERGFRLGRDKSVVTHDDVLSYLQNGADVPIFTATRSSVREAGRLVAEMLLERIANPATPERQILLEAELMVGASTGPTVKD